MNSTKCNNLEHWDEPEPCQLCQSSPLTRVGFQDRVLHLNRTNDNLPTMRAELLAHDAVLRTTIERLEDQIERDAQQIQAVRDLCKPYTDKRDHVVEMVTNIVGQLTTAQARLAGQDRWLQNGVYFTNEEFQQHITEHKATLTAWEAQVTALKKHINNLESADCF